MRLLQCLPLSFFEYIFCNTVETIIDKYFPPINPIKKINGFQKLEEAKEMYLKDSKKFKDLLNNCPGSCFQKIGTIDFVDDNENFKLISDLCDKHELNENVDIFEHIIHSAVEGNDGLFNVTISNSIAFVLQDGSLLRFLPSKGEGLVISRVLVTEINRSRGNGTALMNMFLNNLLQFHCKTQQ